MNEMIVSMVIVVPNFELMSIEDISIINIKVISVIGKLAPHWYPQ